MLPRIKCQELNSNDRIAMFVLTMDLEWAPDPVLGDVFELLSDYGVSSTLFSTHEDGFDLSDHERALHPNFLQDSPEEDVLRELAESYPEATGIRSHGLYVHSPLRDNYDRFGLEYESNYMMEFVDGIRPFSMPSGFAQFPIYFMDDDWFRRRNGDEPIPDIQDWIEGDGLRVFDFHPPHIAFNTPTEQFYEDNRDRFWQETVEPKELRYEGLGVRDLFRTVLEYVAEHDVETSTLGELAEEFEDGGDPT